MMVWSVWGAVQASHDTDYGEAMVCEFAFCCPAQGSSIPFVDGLDQVAGQPGAQGASETGQLLAGLLAQCPTLRLLATAGDGGSNTNV